MKLPEEIDKELHKFSQPFDSLIEAIVRDCANTALEQYSSGATIHAAAARAIADEILIRYGIKQSNLGRSVLRQ